MTRELRDRLDATPRSCAPETMAAASGCSLAFEAGGQPSTDASVWSASDDRRTRGLPSVSVPVLSTTSVSTFSISSSASASLMSTPSFAPRPTPTMMETGVAKPRAQGHAMMSTLIATTSASRARALDR